MASASQLSKDFLIAFEFSEDPIVIKRATIFFPERRWKWELSMSDFEVVHGLSRVVRLIPDKAAVARSINIDSKVDDDGSFIIELVEKLAKDFSTIHREKMATRVFEDPEDLVRFKVEYGPHEEGSIDTTECDSNLGMALEELVVLLFNMKNCLITNQSDDFDKTTVRTLQLADDLLLMSQVFLDLIHPVWVTVNRAGEIDNTVLQTHMDNCESKLIDFEGRLLRDYNQNILDDV
jgi:hypothetical protein